MTSLTLKLRVSKFCRGHEKIEKQAKLKACFFWFWAIFKEELFQEGQSQHCIVLPATFKNGVIAIFRHTSLPILRFHCC